MTVLFVDVAGSWPSELDSASPGSVPPGSVQPGSVSFGSASAGPKALTASAAAERWQAATGAPVRVVSLSDGTAGFLDALAPATGPAPIANTRRDAAGTTYAAAGDFACTADVAEFLAAGAPRTVLATARRPGGMKSAPAAGAGVGAGSAHGASSDARPDGGVDLLVAMARLGGMPGPQASRAGAGELGVAGVRDMLAAGRQALAGTDLIGAVEADTPLLGLSGVAATGTWPGGAGEGQDLERRLSAFADLAHRADMLLPARAGQRRLMAPPRAAALPGAGSGGGLGHAVALLGGRLRPALHVVADVVGLTDQVADCDLVVAIVAELSAEQMSAGLVPLVGPAAARSLVPVVVVAGRGLAGRREWSAAGVAGVYELGETTVERVARTWSGAATR